MAFERVDLVAGDDLQHQDAVAVHVGLDRQQELPTGRAFRRYVTASVQHNERFITRLKVYLIPFIKFQETNSKA